MLALLGSRAPPRRRGRNLQAPNWASHEAKVTPYPPLPDVMVTNAGTKVTAAREWWEVRRPELVELFDRQVYGRMPKTLPKVSWAVTTTTDDHDRRRRDGQEGAARHGRRQPLPAWAHLA